MGEHSKRLSAADRYLLNNAKIGVVNAEITAGILRKYGFGSVLLLDEKSGKKEDLKSKLCGCDVIIGAGEEGDTAKAAEKLGVPFIPTSAVTTILPDGVRYREIIFPRCPQNFKNETIACAQACEVVNIISGAATPTFAPLALVAERDGSKLRKVKLRVKRA
jgi:hypothetical protein